MEAPNGKENLSLMSRTHRLHHPGNAFHIVSRTQGHVEWFKPLKTPIADLILEGVASAGAQTIAFAVMDNHFHLILLQGTASLGYTMQPVLRRIALLVQRKFDVEGHVFERRFRSKLCSDAEYLPNAILYVHRNPVDAGICTDANEYEWSSAKIYEVRRQHPFIAVETGLRVFGLDGISDVASSHAHYLERLRGVKRAELDGYWEWFWRAARRRRKSIVPNLPHRERAQLRDLRDVALSLLRQIDPYVEVEFVRSRFGGKKLASIRRELIAALGQRGYSGVAISNYLRISQATVSRTLAAARWAQLDQISGPAESEDGNVVRSRHHT